MFFLYFCRWPEVKLMKRFVPFILCILVLSSCSGRVRYSEDIEAELDKLDEVIAGKAMIEEQKEYRISQLVEELETCESDADVYGVYDRLFDEYFQYNIDSALFYASKKLELAKKIETDDFVKDAELDLADRYIMSGLYEAALDIFDDYGEEMKGDPRYLSLLNTIYSNLEKSTSDPSLVARYSIKKDAYRKAFLSSLDEGDLGWIFVKTDILSAEGKCWEVLDLLLPWIETNKPSIKDQGVIYYTIARAYDMLGDSDNAVLWYARSAIRDLLVPKYEYMSLYELAAKLYEANEIERAYTYITRSVEDAVQSNAQLHKQLSSQILPVISESYNKHISQKNKSIKSALLISLLLLILLVVLSIFLIRERSRVVLAESQTKEVNQQLQQLAEELQSNVAILQETNLVKEMYLGRYLSMCSDYIDGLEKYRTSLRKISKEGGDLTSALKSKEFMENALEEFYTQFDATFLELFPDFISQLNELLQEDMKVTYHSRERLLTTELRVLALIRLGVNDSVKIAHFLRRSVSTIYNYRVKMRNSAICDRDEFESHVMRIGARL